MYNFIFVHIVQSFADLTYYISSQVFRHSSFFLQKTVKLPGKTEFHQKIYVILVGEKRVHLHDIGVVEEDLNFYLSE